MAIIWHGDVVANVGQMNDSMAMENLQVNTQNVGIAMVRQASLHLSLTKQSRSHYCVHPFAYS